MPNQTMIDAVDDSRAKMSISHRFRLASRLPDLFWATGAILLAFAVLYHTMDMAALRFDVPMRYGGDGFGLIYNLDSANRASADAAADTGMPFGSTLYDGPNADAFNYLVFKTFASASGQFGIAYNLYFLSTIVLVGLCGYASGRKLGLAPPWAFALSVLFNLLPFHMERIGHLFYNNYAPAAVATWLALDAFSALDCTTRQTRRTWWLVVPAAIFCGCSGIYYAFFSCLFVLTATLVALCERPSRIVAMRGALILGCIGATSFLNLLPSFLYWWSYGENVLVAHRSPMETELFGLKLIQMLLPITDHRIDSWANLRLRYFQQSPLINENETASLGVIGSLGLLVLLAAPFIGQLRDHLPASVKQSAPLAWIGFAYGTIGGLGALFSWYISPQLHGLNRISVFLGFIALLAFMAAAQSALARFTLKQWVTAAAVLPIVALGIFDMTPRTHPFAERYRANAVEFDVNKDFAAKLESALPAGSMLFQLPYLLYPEAPQSPYIGIYEMLAPIIHAHHLRWTFGAMNGRPEGRWYELVAAQEPQRLIQTLRDTGFRGIVVDRRGYADRGASLEKQFAELGLHPSVQSGTANQVFYPLADSAAPADMASGVAPGRNWSAMENHGTGNGFRSRGPAEVVVSNVASERADCQLQLQLESTVPQMLELFDGQRALAQVQISPGTVATLQTRLDLVPKISKRLWLRRVNAGSAPANANVIQAPDFFWLGDRAAICAARK